MQKTVKGKGGGRKTAVRSQRPETLKLNTAKRSLWFRGNKSDTATMKGWTAQTLLLCAFYFTQCAIIFVDGTATGKTQGAGGQMEASSKEYCQWETLNATCGRDEVVVMQSARYGRMRLGRCLVTDVSIGCGSDVLLTVDARCSGRHHCSINLPDADLHRQQSCPKDMVAYLEASYTCLKGPESELHGPSGYLASIVTETTLRGATTCPWKIRAAPGQRINLTLFDFTGATDQQAPTDPATADGGRAGTDGEAHQGAGGRYCQVYAIIKEANNERETAVCGGSQRERGVYTSTGNAVDVAITGLSMPEQQVYFVLKYEAVGCADISPPANAWFSRDGDKAVVKCNFTGQTWHLVCKSTTWIGEMTNCTGSSWANGQRAGRGVFPPYGLLVAVIIGVILGVVLGLCLLGIVLGCKRKRGLLYKAKRAPGQRAEFYDSYDRATFKEQTCTLRRGEPGYTHVWELRSQKLPQEVDCAAAQKLSAYHDRAAHVRTTYPSLQPRRDHIYESPKFERRTLGRDPRSGEPVRREYPFCSTFDPNVENARNMTLRSNKCEEHDMTSDDTEDEIECDIHFPKKVGYRPVPHQGREEECRAAHHNV